MAFRVLPPHMLPNMTQEKLLLLNMEPILPLPVLTVGESRREFQGSVVAS